MSKILFAYMRPGLPHEHDEMMRRVVLGAKRITPDNPNVKSPRVLRGSNSIVAVMNPSDTVSVDSDCICLGHVSTVRWQEPGSTKPEGTYAICRSDSRIVELLSDATASRTLWYYIDETLLLASTSQRWMATVLGRFEANDEVLTWMLAAGSLGPAGGWDRRVKRLPADSSLTVNLETWSAELTTKEVSFQEDPGISIPVRDRFRSELLSAMAGLNFDFSKWVLPLSGGYDSRAILCMLGSVEGLRTITWGTKKSQEDPQSDAAIARRVANQMGVTNEYFETDVAKGSLAEVFEKFIAFGEGRVTNISGYLDGFAIWQALLDRGVEGVIRGDEGFGWKNVHTFEDARRSVRLTLWSDFTNLPGTGEFDLPPQEMPAFLRPGSTETPCQWRDRLYHQFRAPTILAALTDLKAPFVEVANPFLTYSVINAVRTLPDDLRTDKRLFREIVDDVSPSIPFASTRSILDQRNVLRSREAVELLDAVLSSGTARSVFSGALLTYILHEMHAARGRARPFGSRLKRNLQKVVTRLPGTRTRGTYPTVGMDFNEMAFRVFLVCKTRDMMNEDARAALH